MTGAPLLVIDGDSIGHRAYHAMPPVPDADGRPSGLLLGFANVLVATWDGCIRARCCLSSTRGSEAIATSCCRGTRGSDRRSRAI